MTLEIFGYILMALGLLLFVYGYLKASKRLDVEEQMAPRHVLDDPEVKSKATAALNRIQRGEARPGKTAADLLPLPRVTEQEKREAFKIAAVLPVAQELIDDGCWPVVRVRARPALYDWQESHELD